MRTPYKLAFSAILACCLAPVIASADAVADWRGKLAPDFKLSAASGSLQGDVQLSELLKDGPVAIVVLRGYPGYQCPICSRQVGQLIKRRSEFEAKHAQVLLIYPGDVRDLGEKADEFLKGSRLPPPLTLLLDPGYEFTDAYGLRWDAPRETAYPTAMVINQDGSVAWQVTSGGHGDRANPDEILSHLSN